MQYTSCLSNKLKDEIINEIKKNGVSNSKIEDFIKNLPSCEDRKTKTKRAPSEYNLFIGKCMKEAGIKKFSEAPQKMRSCVLEWKKTKGK